MPQKPFRERIIAGLLGIAGTYVLALSSKNLEWMSIHSSEYLLAIGFAAAIILANRFPIHLQRGTKIILINLPIFLSAVLLSAPLAMAATGCGLFVANLLVRVERGLLPRDIAATVGQWMLTVALGNQIAHLQLPAFNIDRFFLLLLSALVFLLIDFTVFSLSQSLIYDQPFLGTLISVINQGFSLEAIQYLIAILGSLAFGGGIWSLILLFAAISITYVAFKNIKETRHETVQILKDMADTVDLRDVYTGGHSKRVADLVQQTLVQLRLSGPEATLIEISARLHDIGKIGIPDSILMKPDKLLPEEIAVMQTHSQKGAELISKYKDFARGALIILHHHESWDGKGYPAGLKEHDIPFGARVIAVADSFDAMTSDRPYRKGLSSSQAIQILLAGCGKQWDPTVVKAFVEMMTGQAEEKSTEPHPAPRDLASSKPVPSSP